VDELAFPPDLEGNGAAVSAVEGCIDIDLKYSPSTNLLPIRRLNLAIGESAEVTTPFRS
jgi:hypothetical protein